MSKYELCALILSTIAILIPIIQWVYNKYFLKPILNHYSTGRALLFINRSGSYIRLEGVFESINKSLVVKDVNVKVNRKKDGNSMNLVWSTFVSPMNQQIAGAYASVSEIAHPIRVEVNSVANAFIEFTDFNESSSQMIQPYYEKLVSRVLSEDNVNQNYSDIYKKYINYEEYRDLKQAISKELFWIISDYELEIKVKYENEEKIFRYKFNISKELFEKIESNIVETCDSILKLRYRIDTKYNTLSVKIVNT